MNFLRNYKFWLIIIILLFVIFRFFGIGLPYHLDEQKWVANSVYTGAIKTGLGHPPLTGIIFYNGGKIFGADFFRGIPLVFGLINLGLVYFFVARFIGKREALWSLLMSAVIFYNFWANLMVDTDGAIIPFFFLISLIFYFEFKRSSGRRALIAGLLSAFFLLCGLLTKLSFILIIGATTFDFIFEKRLLIGKYWKRILIFCSLGVLSFLGAILLIKFIMPAFDSGRILGHAADFFRWSGRNYFQILFQILKASFYLSPLVILSILIPLSALRRLLVLPIYIVIGLIFYLVLFDFSSGALDKYLMFLALPLAIMSGISIANLYDRYTPTLKNWLLGLLPAIVILILNFVPQFVAPLYPKTEWISRVFHFEWNILIPFTGGSGPTGFYVSLLFIFTCWFVTLSLFILYFYRPGLRKSIFSLILILGISYNLIFAEELILGKINGSVPKLFRSSLAFIESNDKIQKVMTYNDIGGLALQSINKYERRIFAAPKYEAEYIDILNNFKGFYLVINIPQISDGSILVKYFNSCSHIFNDQSGVINSTIYDCQKAKNL